MQLFSSSVYVSFPSLLPLADTGSFLCGFFVGVLRFLRCLVAAGVLVSGSVSVFRGDVAVLKGKELVNSSVDGDRLSKILPVVLDSLGI